MPTVIVGSARDVVEECGVPRFVFSDFPLGNPCGVILRAKEGKTLYHMGDMEVFGDMALINVLHAPDIGIVPIGDRFTMGARSAAHAFKSFFTFKTVFPAHYGTFPIIDQTADAFVAEMKGHIVVVPKLGEVITV